MEILIKGGYISRQELKEDNRDIFSESKQTDLDFKKFSIQPYFVVCASVAETVKMFDYKVCFL